MQNFREPGGNDRNSRGKARVKREKEAAMSVVKRKAERRIAPGGESRGESKKTEQKGAEQQKQPMETRRMKRVRVYRPDEKEENTDKPQFGRGKRGHTHKTGRQTRQSTRETRGKAKKNRGIILSNAKV